MEKRNRKKKIESLQKEKMEQMNKIKKLEDKLQIYEAKSEEVYKEKIDIKTIMI